jgi:hypothetical protein
VEKIILNAKEYNEKFNVELDMVDGRLCVIAYNEGGYNITCVDAEQLYRELKDYFERNKKLKN